MGSNSGGDEMEGILSLALSLIYSLLLYFFTVLIVLFLLKEVTMGIYRGRTRLDGRLVIITGGSTGIGLETARDLANRGATVVLGCRSKERGETAAKKIISSTGNPRVEVEELDLLSLVSVHRFVKRIISRSEPVHILINNAGIHDAGGYKTWAAGKSHLSNDGLEITTQTNHLSHFLLTNLLREKLAAAGNARVINVSSIAALGGKVDLENINYEKDKSPKALTKNYNNSKLMTVMFTWEISKRWSGQGISAYSLHPGLVRSEVTRNVSPTKKNIIEAIQYLFGKSAAQGAQTTIFLACQPDIEAETGSFFADCRNWDFILSRKSLDPVIAAGLWERSVKLVGLEE